ncbi:hypothetical protein KIW84_030218 [Lathyrus oleraceus]|uniref:Uncharacterized protein n=1 Tax=Pisum sativum TaxID=3888 RepID=A0A9D4XMB3_PEA|nr:hypothetical protein KIW84_030218 [Pisum sativum]
MDADSNINDKTKSNNAEEVEQAYNRRYWNAKYEATVLSALATFRILQEPIYNLLELISIISQTKVSVDRIQEFLQEEDQNQFMNKHVSKTSRIVIEVKPGELPKEEDQNQVMNKDVSKTSRIAIEVKPGELPKLCRKP